MATRTRPGRAVRLGIAGRPCWSRSSGRALVGADTAVDARADIGRAFEDDSERAALRRGRPAPPTTPAADRHHDHRRAVEPCRPAAPTATTTLHVDPHEQIPNRDHPHSSAPEAWPTRLGCRSGAADRGQHDPADRRRCRSRPLGPAHRLDDPRVGPPAVGAGGLDLGAAQPRAPAVPARLGARTAVPLRVRRHRQRGVPASVVQRCAPRRIPRRRPPARCGRDRPGHRILTRRHDRRLRADRHAGIPARSSTPSAASPSTCRKAVPTPGNPPGAKHPVPPVIQAGVQHMDGTPALAYVRSRKADTDYHEPTASVTCSPPSPVRCRSPTRSPVTRR